MLKAEYREGDVVWARHGKWSWWPSLIKAIHNENNNQLATISLIDKGIEKKVMCSSLKSFDDKTIKLRRKGKSTASFSNAIVKTNKILQGLPIMESKFKVDVVREGGRKEA